jgi:UDP-N-acetylmuramoyl-tripeptide--D-alanyl-D-alanine ligase
MEIDKLYRIFTGSNGVTTDTRAIAGGELFFALRGENFDGNRFVGDAIQKGCSFAVADDPALECFPRVMVVPDALKALQDLAAHHRRIWRGLVLAITGSNGKTTTRELVTAVLSRKFSVASSTGNLNNHIGVPLTLLKIRNEELAVIEMGANHQGEIALLAEIAAPETGIITNVGKAHLEGFGSLEGVKRAKGELFDYLAGHNDKAIVNISDPVLEGMAQQRDLEVFSYGVDADCNVMGHLPESADGLKGEFIFDGKRFPLQSELFGKYNFYNMLAAAATGIYYGVSPEDISGAVAGYLPENNRSQLVRGKTNTLILDAYNANPTSMLFALKAFMERDQPKKMVILGDMYELGEDSEREHMAVLQQLAGSGINEALLVGERFYTFASNPDFPFRFFVSLDACMDHLRDNLPENYLILLKGSRKNALERATNLLLNC